MGKWGTIIVTALIAAFLTFLFGLLLESRKRRRELKKIRSKLLEEMKWNCKALMDLTPFDLSFYPSGDFRLMRSQRRAGIAIVAEGLSMLSSSVYEKYMQRLYELKDEEFANVYDLYNRTKYCAEQGRKYVNGERKNSNDIDILFSFCKSLLYSTFYTIRLFENGVEGLCYLMEKHRSEQRLEGNQNWEYLDPDSEYNKWLNKYGHKNHPQAREEEKDCP